MQRSLVFILSVLCWGLGSSSLKAQIPTSLFLDAPILESGVDLQIGAIYRFSDVTTGTDALLTIMDLKNGATITILDDLANGGPQGNFQPTITGTPSLSPSVDFNIAFVATGTLSPVVLNNVNWSIIDIDGQAGLAEFNQLSPFGSYIIDNPTSVNVEDLGGAMYKFFDTSGVSQAGIGLGGSYAVTLQFATLQSFNLTMGMQGSSTSAITRLFSDGTAEPSYASPQVISVPESGGVVLIAAAGLLILLRWPGRVRLKSPQCRSGTPQQEV
jgi:hypothetical protein